MIYYNFSKILKRLGDIILSLAVLVMCLPIFLVIGIMIKTDSSGPVFFKQGRLGKHGKTFQIYKFRSMVQGAEKTGTGLFNYDGDPRVTKVGRILRNTSLDELPQLFNVLSGNMSFVGPRPPVVYELGDYNTLNSRYKKRFEVVPGITGLAQVSGRNDISWDEKVNYDNQYIDEFKVKGIFLDIQILFRTVQHIFTKQDICEAKLDESLSDEESARQAAFEVIRKAHELDGENVKQEE